MIFIAYFICRYHIDGSLLAVGGLDIDGYWILIDIMR
jgi:hypothetical protein